VTLESRKQKAESRRDGRWRTLKLAICHLPSAILNSFPLSAFRFLLSAFRFLLSAFCFLLSAFCFLLSL
jgi:hypothetical protein